MNSKIKHLTDEQMDSYKRRYRLSSRDRLIRDIAEDINYAYDLELGEVLCYFIAKLLYESIERDVHGYEAPVPKYHDQRNCF